MMKRICIKGLPEAGEILFSELQNGFYIEAAGGTSIRSFLTGNCEIPAAYIEDRIKTVFHNSNPVDNLDLIQVSAGSVVAVSGAMPGLVGAMMRMGSPYASMRESITDRNMGTCESGIMVFVKLKLFNVILDDLGYGFVSRGVILDRYDTVKLIKRIAARHASSFSFTVDGLPCSSLSSGKLADEKYIIQAI